MIDFIKLGLNFFNVCRSNIQMKETISIHYVDKALWITEKLLNTSNFRKPLVFLHKSSCLEELGRLDEAIDVLRELSELSPEHRIATRAKIAELKRNQGCSEDEDDEYFIDLEQSERVDATYVFQKMAEFVDRGEQGDDRAQRAAADLGLYIMTHGFRIALEAEQVFLYRAQVIGFSEGPSRGRFPSMSVP